VLEFFGETDENENIENAENIAERETGDKFVTVAGIINEVSVKRTKNGDTMAFLTFEDEYSSIEVVVFSKKYTQFFDEMKVDNIIAVQGNISPGRDENPKILLNNIIKLKKNGEMQSNTNERKPANIKNPESGEISVLYLKVPDTDGMQYKKAVNLIEIFDGTHEVKIYDETTKKICSIKNPGTDMNNVCVSELKNLLGEDNVKIVKKSKAV
jgi:DNA polymerase-3 subunit alpha